MTPSYAVSENALIALTLARTLAIARRDGHGWQKRLPYFRDITIRW